MKLNKTRIKLKIEKFFIQDLWQYLLVFASVALCSWIFNRWIEGVMFCISHTCVRNAFNKQFHFDSVAYCLSLTLAIIWFAIPASLPINISLLSSIPIAFIISFIGYIVQDRIDLMKELKELDAYSTRLVMQLAQKAEKHKDIYAMSEDELYQHCRDCGLGEEDCRIAYFVVIERLQGKELYSAIGYSERQTKRKRKKILDTIK